MMFPVESKQNRKGHCELVFFLITRVETDIFDEGNKAKVSQCCGRIKIAQ